MDEFRFANVQLESPKPLTAPQSRLYNFIRNFYYVNGYMPTMREMMVSLGLKSLAPVSACLELLKKKGWIDWVPGRARTIKIRHPGVEVLGEIFDDNLAKKIESTHYLSCLSLPCNFFSYQIRTSNIPNLNMGDYLIFDPSKRVGMGIVDIVDGSTRLVENIEQSQSTHCKGGLIAILRTTFMSQL